MKTAEEILNDLLTSDDPSSLRESLLKVIMDAMENEDQIESRRNYYGLWLNLSTFLDDLQEYQENKLSKVA